MKKVELKSYLNKCYSSYKCSDGSRLEKSLVVLPIISISSRNLLKCKTKENRYFLNLQGCLGVTRSIFHLPRQDKYFIKVSPLYNYLTIECILLKFHLGMKALTEVHFENVLRSTLSYPNETSKECIQFLKLYLNHTKIYI